MTGKIKANEYPLSKIFSQDFEYYIPPYQRPYAWTEDEAKQLLTDIYNAYTSTEQDNYFIGSIVLIKEEACPKADIIDGQQRLTTLTILLSALVKCLTIKEDQDAFSLHLKQPKNVALKLEGHSRLNMRPKDRNLFETYILNYDFDGLAIAKIDSKKESHKNIQKNAIALYKMLREYFSTEDEFLRFGQFLVGNCYLVVVSVEDQTSASRIFSVLNSRGLDLLPTDILKAELIDKISESKQDEYTQNWEMSEENLMRDNFAELFSHIRMIYAKNKAEASLLEEFRKHVIDKYKSMQELLDKVIFPYAEIFDELINESFDIEDKNIRTEINEICSWLNRIDVSDWKPVALAFCLKNNNNPKYLKWFMQKLERLSAVLFITGASAQERIKRFAEVLTEIEAGQDTLEKPLKSIELTTNEKKKALEIIAGDIYDNLTWLRCKYLILRTNSFIAETPQNYNVNVLSIEHVLPQTLNMDWQKQWGKNNHKKWLNKIANLVLLSRRKNAQAQNYNFQTKKTKYFATNNTCSFALTTRVAAYSKWTPEIVNNRQNELLAIIKEKWEL